MRAATSPALALAAAVALTAPPAEAQETGAAFAGKTLRLVVGMPPGGGVDAYARLVQRHMERHLPGGPSIVAQNMPGAGSLRAVQSLAGSPEDGTVLVTFSSSLITESILAPDRVKVDFRQFAFLGNVSEDARVCYVRSQLGIRGWQDLVARDQVVFGGSAAGSSGNLDVAMLRNLFALRIKLVQGYPGSAEKKLALEKGEIDGDCGGATSIPQDWLDQRKVDFVIRQTTSESPGLPKGIPYGGDLIKSADDRRIYEFLTTPLALGRLFMVSSKVPADRLAGLRRAFDAAMADPAFLAEAARLRLTVTPTRGADVDARVAALYATPKELIDRARAITAE